MTCAAADFFHSVVQGVCTGQYWCSVDVLGHAYSTRRLMLTFSTSFTNVWMGMWLVAMGLDWDRNEGGNSAHLW